MQWTENEFFHFTQFRDLQGLKGDDIVKCMGKSYGRESGCKLLVPNPKTYLCNDKYITSESLYNVILKSAPTTS